MKLTEQQKHNISQLIRSESTHELGIQQAKLFGYDKECEWEYRLDNWYYQDSFEKGLYNSYTEITKIRVGLLEIRFVFLLRISSKDSYYIEFKYNDDYLSKIPKVHRDMVNCFNESIINKFFEVKWQRVAGYTGKRKVIECDGLSLYEYVFEVIKQNQEIFNDYIQKVVE